MSINIFLNLFGFCFTENVDWAWNNLRYASHKVCLDHFFVDFDLLPLLLTIFCGLNIEVSLSNRSVRGFYDVLDVNELFWRVTYDLCLREDKCFVIKNRIEAEELELIIRFEFCFYECLSWNADGATGDAIATGEDDFHANNIIISVIVTVMTVPSNLAGHDVIVIISFIVAVMIGTIIIFYQDMSSSCLNNSTSELSLG